MNNKNYKVFTIITISFLLIFSNMYITINSSPVSGARINEITSILWAWDSNRSENAIHLQDYRNDVKYYFSCIGGKHTNLVNNLTILLYNGGVFWNNFTIDSSIISINIDNIDDNDLSEIIVGTRNESKIYLFNVTSFGNPIWTKNYDNLTAIAIQDLHNSSYKEIVLFSDDKISLLNNNGTLLWNISVGPITEGAYCFDDINFDNNLDIVFGTNRNIIALNGINQSILWNRSLKSEIKEIRCSDIDNNNIPDILLTHSSNLTRLNGSNGDLIWNYTGSKEIALDEDAKNIIFYDSELNEGKEIFFSGLNKTGGSWMMIYKLNYTGAFLGSFIVGMGNNNITGLVKGDVNGDRSDELISSDTSGQVIAWKSSGEIVWNYTYSSSIYSIKIGYINFDSIPDILVGASDGQIIAIGIEEGYINLSLFYLGLFIGLGIFAISIILVFYGFKKIKSLIQNKERE
ncbi:MAG: hypothetical protein GF329_00445 [Candidatus Lokiarchaeota archaeon]|nr:hypothetical protein [Candidatus Lokiarchaeota archaeon]